MRYLISVVAGTILVFVWGGFAWAGGLYNEYLRPMPGGDAMVAAIDRDAPQSGMYVYPSEPDWNSAKTPEARTAMENEWVAKGKRGPTIMMAFTKAGQNPFDSMMFVRGILVEFFATSLLVAAVGLAGARHGPLRRFLTLLAIVTFMNLSTHMIGWAFMATPNDWTAVLCIDGTIGWTLAGLPAVWLMRSMREATPAVA